MNIDIDLLTPGQFQPRAFFSPEALSRLAESIASNGIIEPIIARSSRVTLGSYEIIAGERRWRAAQLAGLHQVPVVIRQLSDEAAIKTALVENLQREDLTPVEEVRALERLSDEFDMTHLEIATTIGRSRVQVTNTLRLLNLEKVPLDLLAHRKINAGHAKVLLSVTEPYQTMLARQCATEGWSVEKLTARCKSSGRRDKAFPVQDKDSNMASIERHLCKYLGNSVQISYDAITHMGRMSVEFNSLDEFDGLLQRIGFDIDDG